MQNTLEKVGARFIGISGVHSILSRQGGSVADVVVAEAESVVIEIHDGLQPVECIGRIGSHAVLGIGHGLAVTRRVVRIIHRKCLARQEAVSRAGLLRPIHVVVAESIRASGVGHLGHPVAHVVGVIGLGRVARPQLLHQPVQRIIVVGDPVAVAVGLAQQVSNSIEAIRFGGRGRSLNREVYVLQVVIEIVGKGGLPPLCVSNAGQVAVGVVAVLGYSRGRRLRIGDLD